MLRPIECAKIALLYFFNRYYRANYEKTQTAMNMIRCFRFYVATYSGERNYFLNLANPIKQQTNDHQTSN